MTVKSRNSAHNAAHHPYITPARLCGSQVVRSAQVRSQQGTICLRHDFHPTPRKPHRKRLQWYRETVPETEQRAAMTHGLMWSPCIVISSSPPMPSFVLSRRYTTCLGLFSPITFWNEKCHNSFYGLLSVSGTPSAAGPLLSEYRKIKRSGLWLSGNNSITMGSLSQDHPMCHCRSGPPA